MDPPVSLKCVFFSLTISRVIACVFFLLTTTRVIACVFFSHTTYGSTSVIEMCVLYRDHTWIRQCHCMCVLFSNNQSHFACVFFSLTTTGVITIVFFSQSTHGSTRVIA